VWCFDALLAVVVAVMVPYLMFSEQSLAFERLAAVLLLPIVARDFGIVGGLLVVGRRPLVAGDCRALHVALSPGRLALQSRLVGLSKTIHELMQGHLFNAPCLAAAQ
jgi:hypothetical protein